MASIALGGRQAGPWAPTRFDRLLAGGASILLVIVLVAIGKGRADWSHVPAIIWLHLSTILVALALTPLMLLRRRGDRLHRQIGWVWAMAMLLTALASLFVHGSGGRFSIIHILSVWTLIQVPVIVGSARTHNVARHQWAVRGMVLGALLIAGFFTFPFNRMLGQWLFS